MSRVPIDLAPHAGFCIKTSNLQPALYSPAPSTPGSRSEPIAIPKALKIFVNVAWDKNVPAPPDSSEEDIQRAMLGEDTDDDNPSGWFVPVVVSEGRTDTDKAGKAALTFDCVFNPVVKSRTLRDQSFKMFIIGFTVDVYDHDQRSWDLPRSFNVCRLWSLLSTTAPGQQSAPR